MPVAEHAQMRGHEPKVERERWITRLACVRNAWRPAARSSGYPASAIGDAARMKGRTKRAEDVSSDGPGVPSLTRTYRRNRRRTPEGGDHYGDRASRRDFLGFLRGTSPPSIYPPRAAPPL